MTAPTAIAERMPDRRWKLRRREETLSDMLARLPRNDEPERAEVMDLDQLREHARTLAGRQRLAEQPRRERLVRRFEENLRTLEEVGRLLARARDEGRVLPPAAAWLLGNLPLIRQQALTIRHDLPRGFSRHLPQLAAASADGLPRIYHVSLEFVLRADGQLEEESLNEFIGAYQESAVLRLGELWAMPMMLRLALIENLRGVAVRVARQVARPQSAAGGPADLDLHQQAEDHVSVRHHVASLRALGLFDWKTFVEAQSVVDRVLRDDPAGAYRSMDFRSRDYYRRAVERLARRSPFTEEEVARAAVEQAARFRPAAESPGAESAGTEPASAAQGRQRHVGYWLVDRGRRALEDRVNYRPTARDGLARLASRWPLAFYLGAIAIVWLALVAGAAAIGWRLGAGEVLGPASGLLVLLAFAGAAGQAAVSLVNWLTMLVVPPRPTPRMDFSAGIPSDCRTLVAVPTLLTSERAVRSLIEQLEIRYLGNADENVLFALVTDFPDASQETLPSDRGLLNLARSEIERLNARYSHGNRSPFFLLHRPRKWNPREGVWMGQERKRGKLAALNRLILHGSTDAFSLTVGSLAELASVRYVITLDTDTQLPRDAARELVGCMAHPLNRPRLDPRTRRVVEGHAILQPRVGTPIPEAARSAYSRLFSGDPGIDPYTRETSDLYQDAFGQGSFIGKGIYDVEAFEAALEGRFPDNRVLSHDLIEGCFAHSGFVSDVELFEGYPSRLVTDMSRRHRWIRGDWQIAAWLGRSVPTAHGPSANPLDALARWKIFDNLRRSLTPLFLAAFLVLGWLLAPHLAGLWTLLALAVVLGPGLIASFPCFFHKPKGKPWRLHFKDHSGDCLGALLRDAISLAILPYTVHCHLDAILRTLYRLRVSRRKLLEWTTASEAESRCTGTLHDHHEIMGTSTISGAALAAMLMAFGPHALVWAWPLLAAWALAPTAAWWISRPQAADSPRALVSDRPIRRWARQTWHYFETWVTDADHNLPPDNVQHRSDWVVAHRTSPTNLGLALLADLAACDLGYLSAGGWLDRAGRMLRAMQRLERHRGHFYNWYDTRTLEPMEPRYVSSVDSGNLWGSLAVLQGGLAELPDRPLVAPRLVEGLQDTVDAVAAARDAEGPMPGGSKFDARLAHIRMALAGQTPRTARAACDLLRRIRSLAAGLALDVPADRSVLRQWAESLEQQAARAYRDLARLAFWTCCPASAFGELRARVESLDSGCTLRQVPHAAEQVVHWIDRLLGDAPGLVPADRTSRETGPHRTGASRQGIAEAPSRPGTVLKATGPGAGLAVLRAAAVEAAEAAREQLKEIAVLADLCRQFSAMDFRFLFDPRRRQLAIGFDVSQRRRDESFYDLLASEARLTSFLAVSHGQLPVEHWFSLGRSMTVAGGRPILLSWSGSMFEYLMPMLVMPSHSGTVLDSSCRAAVRRQIRYGRQRGIPWGISESSCHAQDAGLDYQYRGFGVPELGMAPGLDEDRVVAPYASAMATMVAPAEACENLARLEQLGALGPYGFYDALDYTPGRSPASGGPAMCRTVMAHHSAMSLLAFTHVLLDRPMQRRFLTCPSLRAHDLLLQERVPRVLRPLDPRMLDAGPEAPAEEGPSVRVIDGPHAAEPHVHRLTNGRYHVWLTGTGGGVSRWNDLAVAGWDADPAGDQGGPFCYLRDLQTGRFWSSTHQPVRRAARCHAAFTPGQVEYRTVHEQVEAQTWVSVAPRDDVEVRRLVLRNLSTDERAIELTTYAEVALFPTEPESAEQLVWRPFVETEWLADLDTLLSTRRPQSPGVPGCWMFHLLHFQAGRMNAASFETSRERFVGPGRNLQRPAAMEPHGRLSDGCGAVPDPILSVRRTATLGPEQSAVFHVVTGIAETREQALALARRYRDPRIAGRALELALARG